MVLIIEIETLPIPGPTVPTQVPSLDELGKTMKSINFDNFAATMATIAADHEKLKSEFKRIETSSRTGVGTFNQANLPINKPKNRRVEWHPK